jgi:hypothetical protein
MSDEHLDHWKALAKRVGVEVNHRRQKQARIAKGLDWSEWTKTEREVYAAAFIYPIPAEPLIDSVTLNGETLDLKRLSRTARIIDEAGDVWLVVEHGRPMKL